LNLPIEVKPWHLGALLTVVGGGAAVWYFFLRGKPGFAAPVMSPGMPPPTTATTIPTTTQEILPPSESSACVRVGAYAGAFSPAARAIAATIAKYRDKGWTIDAFETGATIGAGKSTYGERVYWACPPGIDPPGPAPSDRCMRIANENQPEAPRLKRIYGRAGWNILTRPSGFYTTLENGKRVQKKNPDMVWACGGQMTPEAQEAKDKKANPWEQIAIAGLAGMESIF
jgi:hypothetical protein